MRFLCNYSSLGFGCTVVESYEGLPRRKIRAEIVFVLFFPDKVICVRVKHMGEGCLCCWLVRLQVLITQCLKLY